MAYVTLTEEILHELERLKRETGIGPMKLLARSQGAPTTLNSAVINSWFNGQTASARERDLAFVLEAYAQIVPIIPITCEMRDDLNAEFVRTGCSPKSLLNRLPMPPKALSAALISRWRTGRTVSARKDLWDFVMKGLRGVPSAQ